ncbi:MAG: insulinase family protein [Gemmatimonadaceae bacterium]|nr:insulinase family protein [Gemmatimonadaceae bacterium]
MQLPIHTHVLANGLRLVISPDRTAPIVAVNVWYHVGSANERPGRTGFAHLFEHMLFQGSEHVAANEHFELVQRAGGTVNGSTWIERTNYYETVPSHQLALALWLEADRMGRLLPAMTQEKLDTQRDVVKNERRWSVDNQPYGTWWERLPALAFPPEHPFHHSLIGSMEDLDAALLDDVKEFFATWYTPDNAVLTIVGDVDVADAVSLASSTFGGIPRGPGRPATPSTDIAPRVGSWIRDVVEDDVMVPRVYLAFRTPPFGTPLHAAAAITTAVLGSGKGSRLHQRLVREQQLATSAVAYTFDLARGSDLLILEVTARAGVDAATLESAVAGEVDALAREGCTASDIERAVALTTTEFVTSMQSAQARADRLSQYATYLGDPALLNSQVARLDAVDADAVTQFARAWLGTDNRVSLVFVPRAGTEAVA